MVNSKAITQNLHLNRGKQSEQQLIGIYGACNLFFGALN